MMMCLQNTVQVVENVVMQMQVYFLLMDVNQKQRSNLTKVNRYLMWNANEMRDIQGYMPDVNEDKGVIYKNDKEEFISNDQTLTIESSSFLDGVIQHQQEESIKKHLIQLFQQLDQQGHDFGEIQMFVLLVTKVKILYEIIIISRVSSVIACGQTGSGKTYTITGMVEQFSLDLYKLIGPSQRVHLKAIEILGDSSTVRNATSSRSHAILLVSIVEKNPEQLALGVKEGRLFLVDLAGSERRSDKVQHNKERMRESHLINESLMTLKDCIRTRSCTRQTWSGGHLHIPYRNSKLTFDLRGNFELATTRPHKLHLIVYMDKVQWQHNLLLLLVMTKNPAIWTRQQDFDEIIRMSKNRIDPESLLPNPGDNGTTLVDIPEQDFIQRVIEGERKRRDKLREKRRHFGIDGTMNQKNTIIKDGEQECIDQMNKEEDMIIPVTPFEAKQLYTRI
ncbi:MAG: putative kinesin family member 2/24 [Streblomastix strix]|uniref:Kinesin-like protein n=1 Tax=Streblomastix strix TaxID=222440 RepID=A0A5J4WZH7_9EUKA|nr:MAG: putative kinesin family member 2/24 [Streblomastix strix]